MASIDSDSASFEALKEIETLRKDSIASPVIQSDNESSFKSMDFNTVLSNNGLTHKRIHPRTPEQNEIIDRANKTVRKEFSPL